jgi:Ca2+-binding RTX toxin-like protein
MAYVTYGTNYSETIYGTNYADDIYGLGGNDVLYGYAGSDWLNGGSGGDILYGGNGNDILIGGIGVNDLWGGANYDDFVMSYRNASGLSDDLVQDFQLDIDQVDLSSWGTSDFSQVQALLETDSYGDATLNAYFAGYDHILTLNAIAPGDLVASDFLYADPGALNSSGTAYDDVQFGSRQNDQIHGNGGADILLGGLGADTLFGDLGNDRLVGGTGHDTLSGGVGSDLLQGDDGADTLRGNAGVDFLEGGSGNDLLVGGAGRDFLEGGAGADWFRFFNGEFGGATAATADRIQDFSFVEGDRIDLAPVDADFTLAGNQGFNFIGTNGFSHTAGELRYTQTGGNTYVFADQNGDATADFAIRIDGNVALQPSDFFL